MQIEQRRLTPKEVYARLPELQNGLILLDVRTPMECVLDGYIEGATHIAMQDLQFRIEELPKDAEIIVYCAHGIRSGNVAAAMKEIGYSNVSDMRGGIDLWAKTGLPVIRNRQAIRV
jgi:rhodanese-related sulfurtransferase